MKYIPCMYSQTALQGIFCVHTSRNRPETGHWREVCTKKRPTRKKNVYIRCMYKVAAVHKGENLASGLYGMGGSQLALWGENVCG